MGLWELLILLLLPNYRHYVAKANAKNRLLLIFIPHFPQSEIIQLGLSKFFKCTTCMIF
jgi:hypothetical protein